MDHVATTYLYLRISTGEKVMILFLSHSLAIITRTEQDLIACSMILHLQTLFKSHNFLFGITTSITLSIPVVINCCINVAHFVKHHVPTWGWSFGLVHNLQISTNKNELQGMDWCCLSRVQGSVLAARVSIVAYLEPRKLSFSFLLFA